MSDDPTEDLYWAAKRYLQCRGGDILVAGGIEILQDPTDKDYNFRLAIRCTGNIPNETPI